MKAAEIREAFLSFFEERGHTRMQSASLIPSSYDPSILLTTAGMQPFKPFFLGQEQPPALRLTSSQKCFRTPDIDSVGLTARHLTSFEMLGNFSFGDYFKAGAVEMAWQLCTGVLGLPADQLWVTIHEGDEQLELGLDEETRDLWVAQGVDPARIVPLGEDNFWKAGATGPCGPCSEIYHDRGAEHGCGEATCAPGCECDRFLEFYNLVFMAFDRDEHGKLSPLPSQNIDTGMGLERIAAILQGNVTVFDIDTLRTLIAWAEARSGRSYGEDDDVATKAFRIIADHGRGMALLCSDGVTPGREGRGYVLRRIIRRAMQQASRIGLYEGSGAAGGVMTGLHEEVVRIWGDTYPELVSQQATVAEIISTEEGRFLRTLERGSAMLDEAVQAGVITGDDAFKLHDTYGFPVELTEEIARENNLSVDMQRFDELMREQRERARAAAGSGELPLEAAAEFVRACPASTFTGYTQLKAGTQIIGHQHVKTAGNVEGNEYPDYVLLKLAESPFYAEGGGQVSDTGTITGSSWQAEVVHVIRFDDDQVIVATYEGDFDEDEPVYAAVDTARRRAIEANHTATHLLHWALRETLGDHVRQAGSLVAPDRLRFDFTHPTSVSKDELAQIESMVNERIAEDGSVEWQFMPIDEARESGAMMLFGEKYGDTVRMVASGGTVEHPAFSKELCGGTHVSSLSQIRLFYVTSESSVGANTRRIEALTADGAATFLKRRAAIAFDTAAAMRSKASVVTEGDIMRLPQTIKTMHRELKALKKQSAGMQSTGNIDEVLAAAEQLGEVGAIIYRVDGLSADAMLELSDLAKGKLSAGVAVLAGVGDDGKVAIIANVTPEAVAHGISAGDIVKEIAPIVGGGGGGRPTLARAGGKDAEKIDEALARAREIIMGAVSTASQ